MLRASQRMPSSSSTVLVSFLSVRLPSLSSWSLISPPVQYRPLGSCSSNSNPHDLGRGVSAGYTPRLPHSTSRNLHVDWRGTSGDRPRLPPVGWKVGYQQRRRRGVAAALPERSSPMASPPLAAAAAAEGGGVGEKKQEHEELVLDREMFSKETTVVAIKLPAKRTSELRARLKKELMNVPHRKNVERCPGDDSCRLLLLKSGVKDPDTLEGLSEEAAAFIRGDAGLSTTTFTVKTDYSMLGVEEVLTRLLGPLLPGKDLPTSFEVAGHLAHLNLREYLLPYKKIIGQVIIDKNARVTTVVNKIDTISTQFRTFPMEVVAGEPNTEVVVKESGCSFKFDFAKVYWNSRLQTEHARLIKVIGQHGPPHQSGQGRKPAVVCDMMAGVGPFAVPLAKNGHQVFANDLNPDSYRALRDNGFRNKVGGRLTTSNECGRAFARKLIRERQVFHHAILNLPDSALTFLDTFRGVDWRANGFEAPPTVHVYCFSKAADPRQDALDRANEVMGSVLTQREVKIHVVRDVAPKKPMLCLSFLAPDAGSGDTGGGKSVEETPAGSVESSPGATGEVKGAAETSCGGGGGGGVGGGGDVVAATAAAYSASETDTGAATHGADPGGDREERPEGGTSGAACSKRRRTAVAHGDERL